MDDFDDLTDEEKELLGITPSSITTLPLFTSMPLPARYSQTPDDTQPNALITPGGVSPATLVQQIQDDMLLPDSAIKDDRALTRIVDMSLTQLQERLLFGDHTVDKYGRASRTPLPAATLSQLVKMGIEQRDAARRQLGTITGPSDQLMIQLIQELQERSPTRNTPRIIDAELCSDGGDYGDK